MGVIGDRKAESDETFKVNLTNAVNAAIADAEGLGTIVNDDGAALMAAFGEQTGGQPLTLTEVQHLMPLALAVWESGAQAAVPADLRVELGDLPRGQLGEAFGHTITLDRDANGAGWFLDRYAPAAGQVDLLTVLSHEIGHALGYEHNGNTADLMAATLPLGTRRLPGLGQIEMESVALGLLSLPTFTAAQHVALPMPEPLARQLPQSAAGGSDLSQWLEPLPRGTAGQSNSSLELVEARIHGEALDGQTELLDEDLLDLLAQAAV